MSEKRNHERLILDGDVHIKTRGKNPLEFRVFLDNFSFGGFAVYSQQKLRPGRIVEFNLITQALDQGLVGRGRIRHVTQPPQYSTPLYTVGVEFTEVNKDLVIHIIHRVQAKIALEMQAKRQKVYAADFIAF